MQNTQSNNPERVRVNRNTQVFSPAIPMASGIGISYRQYKINVHEILREIKWKHRKRIRIKNAQKLTEIFEKNAIEMKTMIISIENGQLLAFSSTD